MTPLERHIRLVSGFAAQQARQDDLAPLMDTGAPPGQRAFVYRNSGMLAATSALVSNYPRLVTLMGEASFRDMARAFVTRHPPEKRSLVGYGRALADFICEHVDDHAMPWLGDLARLDRGWLDAHLAGDAQPIGAGAVAHLSEDDLMATRFTPHPSLRLVGTGFDLASLWSTLDAGLAPQGQVQIPQRSAHHLFWRPAHEVNTAPLPGATAAFLASLVAGKPLAQACQSALTAQPGADLSAIIAFTFQSGLLTGLNAQGGQAS